MTSSYRTVAIVSAVLLSGYVLNSFAQRPRTPKPNHDERQATLMRAKLASTQLIVNGLVSNDFRQVGRGGKDLVRICDSIDWSRNDDPVYAHHRAEMRRLTGKLIDMAERKNLDGAAFTYMHTLTVCISCHQHCRDVLRITDVPETSGGVVPIPTSQEKEAGRLLERPLLK